MLVDLLGVGDGVFISQLKLLALDVLELPLPLLGGLLSPPTVLGIYWLYLDAEKTVLTALRILKPTIGSHSM